MFKMIKNKAIDISFITEHTPDQIKAELYRYFKVGGYSRTPLCYAEQFLSAKLHSSLQTTEGSRLTTALRPYLKRLAEDVMNKGFKKGRGNNND